MTAMRPDTTTTPPAPLPPLPPGFPDDPAPWWWQIFGPTGNGSPIDTGEGT